MAYLIPVVIVLIPFFFLVYQVHFLIGLLRIRTVGIPDDRPGVSLVIAARNEYQNLQRLIPSLLNQEYPDYEIIIINDRSDDESYDYLMEMDKNPRIRVIFIDHLPDHVNSKKYALTLGIKAAKNDIILLTDADCLPASDRWIQRMISGYNDRHQIVLGFSPYEVSRGLLNALIRFETLSTGMVYLSSARNGNPYMGVGRNLSYRKKFFLARKGFNGYLDLTGGDDDLFVNKNSNSSNTGLAIHPEAVTYSVPKKNWKEYINQKIRHMSAGRYYSLPDKLFLGFYSFVHIGSWLVLLISLFAGIHPVVIGSLFLLSLGLYILNIKILSHKTGSVFSLLLIPFIDVVYMFFYIFVGIRTLFTRKVEWTT